MVSAITFPTRWPGVSSCTNEMAWMLNIVAHAMDANRPATTMPYASIASIGTPSTTAMGSTSSVGRFVSKKSHTSPS